MDLYLTKWLFKALEDLKSAKHELKYDEEEMVTSSICFHSQQCIEKLLKAFLIYQGTSREKLIILCIYKPNVLALIVTLTILILKTLIIIQSIISQAKEIVSFPLPRERGLHNFFRSPASRGPGGNSQKLMPYYL